MPEEGEVEITRSASWNVEAAEPEVGGEVEFPAVTVRVREDSDREELTGYWRASEEETMDAYLQARADDERDTSAYRIRRAVVEIPNA